MGLDMYLSKKLYVQNWDHYPANKRWQIIITQGGLPFNYGGLQPAYVEFQIGYWHKANQIHHWFVQHVQDGNDDQKTYWVSPEQLMELQALCKEVMLVAKLEPGQIIVNSEEIAALLPTESGFFFGSTAYNEAYLVDIERTINITAIALNDNVEGECYYNASW
jgi:hypothetical protein